MTEMPVAARIAMTAADTSFIVDACIGSASLLYQALLLITNTAPRSASTAIAPIPA